MKKTERNKLYMFRRVQAVCSDHEESWNSVPAFVEAFTAFSDKVTLIGELGTSQSTLTRGVRRKREAMLKDAVDITLQCAGALRSWALKEGNVQLAESMEVLPSDILKNTLNGAIEVVGFVAEHAEVHAEALEDYGISEEKQQVMQEAWEAVLNEIDAPRSTIAMRKLITRKIGRMVKEADALIEIHLDSLMRILRTEAPEFHELYLSARVAVRSATRRRSASEDQALMPEQNTTSEEPSGKNPGESDDVNSL